MKMQTNLLEEKGKTTDNQEQYMDATKQCNKVV